MEKQKPDDITHYTPARVAWGWFRAFFIGWIAALIDVAAITFFGLNTITILTGGSLSALSQILAVLVLFVGLYTAGTIVGHFQWILSLKYFIPERKWQRASILVTFTLFAAFIIRGYLFDNGLYICKYVNERATNCTLAANWASIFVFGSLVYGLAIGLPQWWTLRRYVKRANWWIVANLVGLTLYHILIINQYENYFNARLLGLGILLLSIPLYALITSLTLYYIARGEKQKRKITPAQ